MDCGRSLSPSYGRCHPDHTAEAGSDSRGIVVDDELFPPAIVSPNHPSEAAVSYLCQSFPFTLIIL